MDQTCHKQPTKVNEEVGLMWSTEDKCLVRVWQHTDNMFELIPWYGMTSKRFTVWYAAPGIIAKNPTYTTDMKGFFARLNDGRLSYLTDEEQALLILLRK